MSGLTVTVEVQQLLIALRANRQGHNAEYQKAKAGYLKVTAEKLSDYLQKLADGELVVVRVLDNPPEDHTREYDEAIAMMEWAQESTIELTQAQFRQYVLDDWGWKEQWVTSNSVYTQAAR